MAGKVYVAVTHLCGPFGNFKEGEVVNTSKVDKKVLANWVKNKHVEVASAAVKRKQAAARKALETASEDEGWLGDDDDEAEDEDDETGKPGEQKAE
jgi:hypothetical protein